MSVQSHDLHLLTGAYAVDALTGDELDEFETHLDSCASCADEVRGLRETAARLGLAAAIAPPPWMREQVLDATSRVRQLPPSGVRLMTADGPRRRRRLSRRLPRPIAVTAMAAAIVVLAILQVGTRHQLQQAQTTNQTHRLGAVRLRRPYRAGQLNRGRHGDRRHLAARPRGGRHRLGHAHASATLGCTSSG